MPSVCQLSFLNEILAIIAADTADGKCYNINYIYRVAFAIGGAISLRLPGIVLA